MLDPAKPTALDLTDFTTYINSCLAIANDRLRDFASPQEVKEVEDELNCYPRLDKLAEPAAKDIFILDEASLTTADRDRAIDTLLGGGVLLEHACAGEATRLGLGTKYLINPRLDLTPAVLTTKLGLSSWPVDPMDLAPMSLGRRHMLQLAWDLWKLAEQAGRDPRDVLSRQWLVVIVNEASADAIFFDFRQARFYGFDPAKVLFMIQRAFHGITKKDGQWVYDNSSPRRLHNHGQMLMQTTMDGQLFTLQETGGRRRLSWEEWQGVLGDFEDKVSFNIEDLDYLEQSLDLEGLAAALKLGDEGAHMVMEVVTNNPDNPQKGGAMYWDPELGRNVMIESFQLKGVANADIKYLNKNINHYPKPLVMARAVRERGLAMPVAVKQGYVYFQPVQGDVNFLVPTFFLRRPELKPIRAWKSGANTPDALEAMARQDKRKGFLEWAEELTGLKLR